MTRRRWIADEVRGDTAALTGDHAYHLARVLRAQAGQEFDISIGGAVRRGTITSVLDDRVEFVLGEEKALERTPQITLALSIFKFDRMEWAMEKCTEIGVSRIMPLIARRTDAHLAAGAVKRRERWERIVLQASEQSRRTTPPEIAAPIKVGQLKDGGVEAGVELRIVLAESEAKSGLREIVETRLGTSKESPALVLAIGPEGGWTEDELRQFQNSGWIAASLGGNILRAETAAIVATAIAIESLRQF